MIRFRWSFSSLGNSASLLLLLLAAMLGVQPACRSSARAREHVEKGNQYFAQKQFSSAENEYRQAIQINPDFADGYYRLGLLQIQQDHPTAARQSFARAVDTDPKSVDARLHLGDLQVSSTQYAEARQQAGQYRHPRLAATARQSEDQRQCQRDAEGGGRRERLADADRKTLEYEQPRVHR